MKEILVQMILFVMATILIGFLVSTFSSMWDSNKQTVESQKYQTEEVQFEILNSSSTKGAVKFYIPIKYDELYFYCNYSDTTVYPRYLNITIENNDQAITRLAKTRVLDGTTYPPHSDTLKDTYRAYIQDDKKVVEYYSEGSPPCDLSGDNYKNMLLLDKRGFAFELVK